MAGFLSNREYKEAFEKGQCYTSHFRKVPSLASVAGWWSDLGMSAGYPLANYYASTPLIAAYLSKWEGLCHGDDKSSQNKYLTSMMMTTSSANCIGMYTLMDYLLYYPFVDGDSLDEQALDNTNPLTRYTNGEGVMVMAVAQAPSVGNGTFIFTYRNQDGVLKTSPTNYFTSTGAGMGSLLTTQPSSAGVNKFLILAEGDTGVRRIETYTNLLTNGGLISLVLCKPLVDMSISEINVPLEISFLNKKPGLPQIKDGAYLNLICNTAGSYAATIISGRMDFIWN